MTVQTNRRAILLGLGILIGAALRIWMLFYMGVFDMEAYYTWAKHVLNEGVTGYYPGVYYPLQMQIFEACGWIVAKFGVPFFIIFKLANLLFDLGSLIILLLLLKRQKANPAYALFYWLHPWFLTVFALGYVDFQFTFFILLCLWLIGAGTTRNYLAAGIPLAAAFLMKPQTQILIVAVFLFALFRFFKRRDSRPFALLFAPVILFLSYEIWFTLSAAPGESAPALILPLSYVNVTNIMPALTAQMPNIWTPIAFLLRAPGQPIILVSDQILLFSVIPIKYLAAAAVLMSVGLHGWRVERATAIPPDKSFAVSFLFASLAVPFLMTSGHENHLFLATVLLIPLMCELPRYAKAASQVLIFVQFLNVYVLYGQGPHWLMNLFEKIRVDETMLVFSLISIVCFALVAKPLWSRRIQPLAGPA
ncbi:MAG: hypothetical protein DME57_05480 [Verrucomicrobia bacterium]|nr:MAG: hypothetical protein DME57_05480 [Verrucomicrobiota bacterium]